jgi:hypothetical protein
MNIENYIDKEYNDVFNRLQDYMLNCENIKNFSLLQKQNTNNTNSKNKQPAKNVQTSNDRFFYPREKDSLFWCFYIMKNGLLNYQMIQHKNIVLEKNYKIEYIEKIRKEKHIIKNYKFASFTNIENNLVNDNKINISTFLTLCVVENINVMFIRRKTYYELFMNDSNDVYIVNLSENDKYGFELIQKNACDKIRDSFFRIDNIDKPLKSITYYKVNELIEICKKLLIDFNKETGKNKSKSELYESIIPHL